MWSDMIKDIPLNELKRKYIDMIPQQCAPEIHKSSFYSQQRMVEDHAYDIAYERIQRLHFIRQLSNERGYGIDTDLPVPLTGHKEMASYVEKLLQSINSTYKRELSIDPIPDSVEGIQQQKALIEKIERDLLLRKVMALHWHNPRHPSST